MRHSLKSNFFSVLLAKATSQNLSPFLAASWFERQQTSRTCMMIKITIRRWNFCSVLSSKLASFVTVAWFRLKTRQRPWGLCVKTKQEPWKKLDFTSNKSLFSKLMKTPYYNRQQGQCVFSLMLKILSWFLIFCPGDVRSAVVIGGAPSLSHCMYYQLNLL